MIEVRPVSNRRERNIFLTFPWRVYKNDPLWVPPILSDRAKATDPARTHRCIKSIGSIGKKLCRTNCQFVPYANWQFVPYANWQFALQVNHVQP